MSFTAFAPQRHAAPADPRSRGPRIPRWPVVLLLLALTALPHDEGSVTAEDLREPTAVKVSCAPTIVGAPTECTASVTATGTDGGGDQSFPVRIATYDNEQGGKPSTAEAVARAQRFDVITAGPHQYKENVAAMKSANPRLVLNVYVNGTHTRNTSLPEGQYCHDASGARITSTGTWSGNILMNPASRGWLDTLSESAVARLRESGYDGVFLDVLGRGALLYNVSGRCIDPRTGSPYTTAAWEQDTSDLARTVRERTVRSVVANGASRGAIYFPAPPSSVVARYVDAGLAEGFTRNGAFFDGYYTEGQIRSDVDMVVDVPSLHVLAKDWRSVSSATKDQEMRYAFAAFLLGTDGHDLFGWTGSRSSLTTFDPLWDVDLGPPKGSYYAVGAGRYRRDFERGKVVVDTVAHTGAIELAPLGGGAVTWSTSSAGTFDPARCVPVEGATSCTVRYLPAPGSAGTHVVTARYEGDAAHKASSGNAQVTVEPRPTATAVACQAPVTMPSSTACTVTVTDVGGGTASPPTGSVAMATGAGGTFTPTACSLVAESNAAASCKVTYTPTVEGDHAVRAEYAGAVDHRGSVSEAASIVVQLAPKEEEDVSGGGGPDGTDGGAGEPPPDVTPPTVDFASPVEGGAVAKGSRISLEAVATDDVAVVKVEFAVNGSVRCTDTSEPWTCSWKVPKAAGRSYTLTVTAWDAAGNHASRSITVTPV